MAEYDGFPPDDESVSDVHRKRLRSRCRAIAWSPPCRTERNRWGESLLAVSNEHLEIVLFRFLFCRRLSGTGWLILR